jgi:mono/diheme cytochrome c family protein
MKKTIVVAVLITSGISLFSFDQKFDLKASIARGKEVYEGQCMSCHLAEGEGIESVYPPVAKSSYLANRDRLVKIIRKGVRGPMTVNGIQYDGEMAGLELSDEQTADVINYIRNSWGNKHPAVTPGEIPAALGTASKDYQPY